MDGSQKEKFIDGLKRALEMEEKMSDVLVDLCKPIVASVGPEAALFEEVRQTMLGIQADTVLHCDVVKETLSAVEEKIS